MTGNKKTWNKQDVEFLKANIGKMQLKELAENLGRSETAVTLFLYRHRIPVKQQVKRNIMRNLLEIKFGNAEYFSANKEFFRAVNINQKRWSQLFLGYQQATEKEMMAVASHFNLSSEEAIKLMSSCQLDLFEK